jgi:hypothetical protein
MEKLAVFKLMEDDRLELCGFFNSKEEALEYLAYVKGEVMNAMQDSLQGEYICIPALYFHIQKDVK